MATEIPRPEAILLISAHWEAPVATLTGASQPELIYDYYGFPAESYQIQYPCPGEPGLAQQVMQVLTGAGIAAQVDPTRGLDHGVFVPLKIMYPQADIPCVQLSLLASLDPAAHIELGRALAALPHENLLIMGSGFSFHNLRAFFETGSAHQQDNAAFENWLQNVCENTRLSEHDRRQLLQTWSSAPGARYCHPRAEHLLPLHVCYGVAQSPCRRRFELEVLAKKCSMYIW
jgi:aromatic ring-opening dioxygenase catalytic subunit (LigB family)